MVKGDTEEGKGRQGGVCRGVILVFFLMLMEELEQPFHSFHSCVLEVVGEEFSSESFD